MHLSPLRESLDDRDARADSTRDDAEKIFHRDDAVTITNAWARFSRGAYRIEEITDAQPVLVPASRSLGVMLAIVGVLLAFLFAMQGLVGPALVGVGMLTAGIALAIVARDTYVLRVATTAGLYDALADSNHERVLTVANALMNAVLARES